jgi:hypothetical protein
MPLIYAYLISGATPSSSVCSLQQLELVESPYTLDIQ